MPRDDRPSSFGKLENKEYFVDNISLALQRLSASSRENMMLGHPHNAAVRFLS